MLSNCGAREHFKESFGQWEDHPVKPPKNQLWIFIGSIDAEAEAPVLWPPDVKSQLIEKDPDAGKNWWQKEKGVTEDEMAGWHNWLNGYESEQNLGEVKDRDAWYAAHHGVRVGHALAAE